MSQPNHTTHGPAAAETAPPAASTHDSTVSPSKLLEEDLIAIRAAAERAAAGLSGWAAFAAVMNELGRYGYTLTRESWPNRQMNSIINQWHEAPDSP